MLKLDKQFDVQLSSSTSTRAWSDEAGGLVAGRAARPAASLSLQLHLSRSRASALTELCFGRRLQLVELNKLCEAQLSQSTSTRAWSDEAGGLVAGRCFSPLLVRACGCHHIGSKFQFCGTHEMLMSHYALRSDITNRDF